MTTPHTIPASAVRAALYSAQLRTRNHCNTPLLAAYTRTAPGNLDCHDGTAPHPDTVARARFEAQCPSSDEYGPISDEHVYQMSRGHIRALIQRYSGRHGPAEMRKTFGGASLAQLIRENPYILNGSADNHPGATT